MQKPITHVKLRHTQQSQIDLYYVTTNSYTTFQDNM